MEPAKWGGQGFPADQAFRLLWGCEGVGVLSLPPCCPGVSPAEGGVNTLPRPRGGLVGAAPSCGVFLTGAGVPDWP